MKRTLAALPALGLTAVLLATSCSAPRTPAPAPASTSTSAAAPAPSSNGRPIALVYKGQAACDGCPEAAKSMLERNGFDVRYIGPNQPTHFSAESLAQAALYVQPGGTNGQQVTTAWSLLLRTPGFRPDLIRDYVRNGGHFLGLCMGGYLAGDPGYNILPGDSDEYIKSKGATVHNEDDQLIDVTWRGNKRQMYFQDGPLFNLDGNGVDVLARYTNNRIAAAVAPYGAGKVAVTGPHPEAPSGWYQDYELPDKAAADLDLGDELVRTVMANR